MDIFSVLGFISLMMIIASVVILFLAREKFGEGDFKNVLNWVVYAFVFMAVPYTIYIIKHEANILPVTTDESNPFIYSMMIIVSICILKASWTIKKFSEVYGFGKK